jgi:hypothetical protein
LPVGTCGAITASSFPTPPSRTGSRRLGKKKGESIKTTYLDEALADFSGYLAIDEVYDGPFCILSVVDNRRYNRLAFRVLDHDPTQDDVRAFLIHEPTVAVRYAVCRDLGSSRTTPFLKCAPGNGAVAFRRSVTDETLVDLRG